MSNPPEPTNLSQKFAALQELMATQHSALMNEITALRGIGPENSLKSINQSIWGLAGPAPGVNLVQLKAAIDALGGGKSLASLFGLWDPGSGSSPYILLDSIYNSLSESGLSQSASKDILVRLVAQFDTSVVSPTMKDLMVVIADKIGTVAANTADPLTLSPAGICDTPFVSTGIVYAPIGMQLVEAFTMATWPDTAPSGITTEQGGIAVGQTIVRCADWSQYHIYVASRASDFGVSTVNLQKFDTNKWVTLSGSSGFEFYVNGNENIKVYICGSGGPPANPNERQNADPGSCGTGAIYEARITDYIVADTFTNSGDGVVYNIYHPVLPDVAGLLINHGGGVGRCDPAWSALHPVGFITVCLSWDFTGNEVWPTRGSMMSDDPVVAADTSVLGLWPLVSPASDGHNLAPPSKPARVGMREYISWSFAAPAALGMPKNVFVHVSGSVGP